MKIVKSGACNGKTAYLVNEKVGKSFVLYGSILFDGEDWIVRKENGRIDRFETLAEAKNEVQKWVA